MLNEELFERCKTNQPITCDDLGLPDWRNNTDGFVYECGVYTIYKTPNGYRHCTGEFVTKFQKWFYGLK